MINITPNKPLLLFHRRIIISIALPRFIRVMIIITPFREMVCEFETRGIGTGVFEIYDYELYVGVLGEEEW